MQRSVSLALSLLGLAFLMLLAGCGGGGQPVIAGPAISVSVAPAGVSLVLAGSQSAFTATVANDTGNKGVTWTVSCASGQCGTISPTATPSGTSTTYTAPATAPASDLSVTVRATSAADTSKSDSATVTVPTEVVSVVPATATVKTGGSPQSFTATVTPDPDNKGVSWTIFPASGAGTLSNMTSTSVTYNPPTDTSDLTVT